MRGGDERHFLQMWLRASTPAPFGYATTHHGFRRWAVLPGFLPDDLSGFLLVVDEFHHVSSSNHIGAAVREWLRRGGKVLYTTATPFRSDRDLPIPEDLVPAYLSLAEHLESGRYSPRKVAIRTKRISGTATRFTQLAGDEMPEGDLEKISNEFLALWVGDGKPKSVLIVPPYGSLAWANRLAKLLSPYARVHVAVGTGPGPAKALKKVLTAERRAAYMGKPSQIDIILACRRFDEGTDWPWCSNVYITGLPYSILRILQLVGRTLRYKGGNPDSPRRPLFGYNPAHMDTASLTFLMPGGTKGAWEEFETLHKDHAFLTACFMEEAETGFAYMAETWRRFDAFGEARPGGHSKEARKTWRYISRVLKITVDETRGLYNLLKKAALIAGADPSDDDLASAMRATGADDETVKKAFLARDLRHRLGNPHVLRALNAKVSQCREPISRRLVVESMQEVFDEVLEGLVDARVDLLHSSEVTGDIFSQFTGQDARTVQRELNIRWRAFDSLDTIKKAIREFHAEHGHAPRQQPPKAPTHEDASKWFGPGVTWWGVSYRCRLELGVSLRRIIQGLGLPVRASLRPPAEQHVTALLLDFVRANGRFPLGKEPTGDVDYPRWLNMFSVRRRHDLVRETLVNIFQQGLQASGHTATPAQDAYPLTGIHATWEGLVRLIHRTGATTIRLSKKPPRPVPPPKPVLTMELVDGVLASLTGQTLYMWKNEPPSPTR
jgi:hypothetical protein